MSESKYQEFADLSFDDFRNRALDSSLSRHEKVEFPDSYREGKEVAIFEDIKSKLPQLISGTGKIVLEFAQSQAVPKVIFNQIGCGRIDDSVVFSLLMRARQQGFDADVLPQPHDLPRRIDAKIF